MQTSVALVQAGWPQASSVLEVFCPYKEGIYVRSKPCEVKTIQKGTGYVRVAVAPQEQGCVALGP